MHVSHFIVLGFFRGPAVEPPAQQSLSLLTDDDSSETAAHIEASNAAAVAFIVLSAMTLQEFH